MKHLAQRVYCPLLEAALRWRYVTVSVGVAAMIVTIGMVLSGLPAFRFMPSIEANVISASVTMPQGAPVEATAAAVAKLEAGAARLRQQLVEETGRDYFRHVLAAVGDKPLQALGGGPTGPALGSFASSNVGEVAIELIPSEHRIYGSEALGLLWRDATEPIAEAIEVDFALNTTSAGSDVDVQLAGPDLDVLRAAAEEVKQRLRGYAGVYEVTDSFRAGKQEMKLGIKPAAEAVGLTLETLGRQVRQAFYGEEAQRIQRGRDDVRVWFAIRATSAARSATSRTCASARRTAAKCPSARSRWSSPGAASRRSGAWTATGPSTSPPRSTHAAVTRFVWFRQFEPESDSADANPGCLREGAKSYAKVKHVLRRRRGCCTPVQVARTFSPCSRN